jgi:nucleotide-binding universal stress UspA family protein
VKKIVVATDGSPPARRALSAALDLAADFSEKPEIVAVYVVDRVEAPFGLAEGTPGAPDLLSVDAQTELASAAEIARERGVTIGTQELYGHAPQAILDYARRTGADLIVTGTHSRAGVARALLGSTCETLIRESPVPVLAIHAKDAA